MGTRIPVLRAIPALLALSAAAGGCGEDPQEELAALARSASACTSPGDCCVVIQGCMAKAYVVGIDEYDRALELAADVDRDGGCAKCMTPAVELRCVEGACVGVEHWDGDGTQVPWGDHCGVPAVEQVLESEGDTGTILGC